MVEIRWNHKKLKLLYNIRGLSRLMIPAFFYRRRRSSLLEKTSLWADDKAVNQRLNYYNKLDAVISVSEKSVALKEFNLGDYNSAYFFDTYEYTRYFNPHLKADFLFGDITFVPQVPSLLKSRPIDGDNRNSVLLNLDKFRHFNFINDRKPFEQKKEELVWRGHISWQKPERIQFLKQFINHPRCNIGNTNDWKETCEWQRDKMTIGEQLEYKFILCLEGVDVATNLKWVMSSNSLAVMPKPKFETWFMEGTLIPGFHYVEIKDDFSDLDEKLAYYTDHYDEAWQIISNAHAYIKQFQDPMRERYISIKVLERYFRMTGQEI